MMHVHLFGRGIPDREYIKGIPLDAPSIGEEFNLKGQGDSALHMKKISWNTQQRESFKTLTRFLGLKTFFCVLRDIFFFF